MSGNPHNEKKEEGNPQDTLPQNNSPAPAIVPTSDDGGKPSQPQVEEEISITCPQCGTHAKVPKRLGSRSIECACCHYKYTITINQQAVQPPFMQYQQQFSPPQQQPTTYQQYAPYMPYQPYIPYQQYPAQYPSPYYPQPYPQYPHVQPQPPVYQPYTPQPYAQPQFPPPAQYPYKIPYSWELYPYSYPRISEHKKPHKSEFTVTGALLATATTIALIAMLILLVSPVLLNFDGNTRLTFKIHDDSYYIIEGAEIRVDNASLQYSDSLGTCTITSVKSGPHSITISKTGYKTHSIDIFLISQVSDEFTVMLNDGNGNEYSDLMAFSDWNDARATFYSESLILGVLSIFMLASTFYTFKRKVFGVAVVGGAFSAFMWIMFLWGFLALNILLVIGSIIGIIALSLIIKNRKYYQGYEN